MTRGSGARNHHLSKNRVQCAGMVAFEYGWKAKKDGRDFWIRFKRCSRKPQSFKEETYAVARTIARAATKPLWLVFSGEVEGEAMCRAFFDQGIHFSVVTFEETGRLSRSDSDYAAAWCRERGIRQMRVRFNLKKFFDTGLDPYIAESYVTGNPIRYFQIKVLETVTELGGHAVLAGGEQAYRAGDVPPESGPYLRFEEGYVIPLEWCVRNNVVHSPYFFASTPELCAAYLTTPCVDFALNDPAFFRHPSNAYFLKRIAYNICWSDLHAGSKYFGIDNTTESQVSARKRLRKAFSGRNARCTIPVSDFRTQLLG